MFFFSFFRCHLSDLENQCSYKWTSITKSIFWNNRRVPVWFDWIEFGPSYEISCLKYETNRVTVTFRPKNHFVLVTKKVHPFCYQKLTAQLSGYRHCLRQFMVQVAKLELRERLTEKLRRVKQIARTERQRLYSCFRSVFNTRHYSAIKD